MAFIWKSDDTNKRGRTANEAGGNQTGFLDAITRAFRRVFDYTGRSTRAEFWWFVLFSCVVNAISYPVSKQLFHSLFRNHDPLGVAVISIIPPLIIFLILFVVWIPLATRRVRDAGKPPILMVSYLLVFLPMFSLRFIKEEYQGTFSGIGSIVGIIVAVAMLIIYLLPSKNDVRSEKQQHALR